MWVLQPPSEILATHSRNVSNIKAQFSLGGKNGSTSNLCECVLPFNQMRYIGRTFSFHFESSMTSANVTYIIL